MALAYQEHYTLEDYQQWEGNWELIEGMPYAMAPSPTVTHQTVSLNVATRIKEQFNKLGGICGRCNVLMETDWHVSNDTVVRPDVMVVCQEVDEKVVATPDLIIEVVSVSSTKRDETMKFELFQREGVLYYVLVYPEKRLAKIYLNSTLGFKRLDKGYQGGVTFEVGKCKIVVNFDSVWR